MLTRSLGVKGWLVVAGTLVLFAGASLGFLAASYLGTRWGAGAGAGAEEPDGDGAAAASAFTNDEIYARLDLREDQRAIADRILGDYLSKVRRNREEREKLGQKFETDFLGFLDPKQRDNFVKVKLDIRIRQAVETVARRVSPFRLDLTLSRKQEDEVFSVFLDDQLRKDEYNREVQSCWKRGEKRRPQEVSKAMAEMTAQRNQKLRSILTDSQWARFQELESTRESFRQRRPSPWGMPSPGQSWGPRPGSPPGGPGAGSGSEGAATPPAAQPPASIAPAQATAPVPEKPVPEKPVPEKPEPEKGDPPSKP